jgi:hypothetical protein
MIKQIMQQSTTTTTTTIIPTDMRPTDWISTVSTIVMVGATVALVIYAAMKMREAKKHRRKDTMEEMLEDAYPPLYEILRAAIQVRTGETLQAYCRLDSMLLL